MAARVVGSRKVCVEPRRTMRIHDPRICDSWWLKPSEIPDSQLGEFAVGVEAGFTDVAATSDEEL